MQGQTERQLKASRSRLLKDRLARVGVTTGGVLVLVALLLIFFYLLYVVQPIFESASVKPLHSFKIDADDKTLALGMEEQAEIGYRFGDSGVAEFFALKDNSLAERKTGDTIEQKSLAKAEQITSFARSLPVHQQFVYGLNNGQAIIVQPKFQVTFPETARTQGTRQVERLIMPRFETINEGEPLQVDEQGRPLEQLAYATDGEGMLLTAVTASDTLLITKFVAEQNFLTGAVSLTPRFEQRVLTSAIRDIAVTPDLNKVFVLINNRIVVYSVSMSGAVSESQVIPLNGREFGQAQALNLMPGAATVLVSHEQGIISQWFEVPTDDGRTFKYIRQFDAGGAIVDLEVEDYRRTFYAVTADGQLNVFHTTSEADLYSEALPNENTQAIAIDPRANHLLAEAGNELTLFELSNEHPEVTWSALWQEVWYEGYPEPSYTWQSTSGSDDFESKFSLVPISFGTIKAALYAMLFAVPIGVAAAVYTAYFMSPSVRKVVKPTVEIMEALPTVILGFLAGLWLAPIVEAYLPGVIAVIVLTPLAIIGFAALWQLLPTAIRSILGEGRASLILVPIVLLVGWLSFSMSPWVEATLFDGNVRGYLTNELGITFDQRNSLVVGIAMGFAVIPTIFSIAEDAVFSVPKHLSNGSLALGATPWQTLTKVVLLTASPGIFSAIMMGLGRAVGETMIVLMATGNTPIMDWNIFEGMRTLSANIAVEMPESEVGSSHYRILFLAAFVLFIFTFFFNTIAEFVRQRLRDKYSSM